MTGSRWSQHPHFGGNGVCVYMCAGVWGSVYVHTHTEVCKSWISTLRVNRTHTVQPIHWLLNLSFCWNQMVLSRLFFFFQNPSFNDWEIWNLEQCSVSSNVVIGPHISWLPVFLFSSCCLSAQLCKEWGLHSHIQAHFAVSKRIQGLGHIQSQVSLQGEHLPGVKEACKLVNFFCYLHSGPWSLKNQQTAVCYINSGGNCIIYHSLRLILKYMALKGLPLPQLSVGLSFIQLEFSWVHLART